MFLDPSSVNFLSSLEVHIKLFFCIALEVRRVVLMRSEERSSANSLDYVLCWPGDTQGVLRASSGRAWMPASKAERDKGSGVRISRQSAHGVW